VKFEVDGDAPGNKIVACVRSIEYRPDRGVEDSTAITKRRQH
jgi:hypothetical protein